MSELRTGAYRAPGYPTIVVREVHGPLVLYRRGEETRTRLSVVGVIAADLERCGYEWSER